MKRIMLILFIGLELSYYLLIMQTGLMEYVGSDLLRIAPLPIGGVLGSLLIAYTNMQDKNKISLLLSLQLLLSFFYPNLSSPMLFLLGLSAGALAPLMVHTLKKALLREIGLALGLSYAIGTAFFTYDVTNRAWIALTLSAIVLVASRFLPEKKVQLAPQKEHSLWIMTLWIFLDSALFETLSRDAIIPIWRLGMSGEIIFFHLVGVVLALMLKSSHRHKEISVLILFALSYLLYFMHEAQLLAVIYPIVISYYNVLILQTLRRKELKTISIYMVFIAWIASGAGLVVALHQLPFIMPIFIIIALMGYKTNTKGFTMFKLFIIAFSLLFSSLLSATTLHLSEGTIKAHTEVFGDSGIDPFTTKITSTLDLGANPTQLSGEISIPSISLKSENEGRDEHMHEAMNAEGEKVISVKLLQVKKLEKNYQITANLTLNGVTKKIISPCKITEDTSSLQLDGNFTIKMTDYNIEQPSMLFFTVRDAVDVHYNLKYGK